MHAATKAGSDCRDESSAVNASMNLQTASYAIKTSTPDAAECDTSLGMLALDKPMQSEAWKRTVNNDFSNTNVDQLILITIMFLLFLLIFWK